MDVGNGGQHVKGIHDNGSGQIHFGKIREIRYLENFRRLDEESETELGPPIENGRTCDDQTVYVTMYCFGNK